MAPRKLRVAHAASATLAENPPGGAMEIASLVVAIALCASLVVAGLLPEFGFGGRSDVV